MSVGNSNTATDFHSNIAEDFDSKYLNSQDFIDRFETWIKFLSKYIKPDDKVLDAGCGSGIFSFFLAKKGVSVYGIDGADGMIELCNIKKGKYKLDNVYFIKKELPLELDKFGQFDVIISSSVMEYIVDFDATIQNFFNLLPAEGHLILSLPNRESYYRKLELLLFKITERPAYLKHVHNLLALDEVNKRMQDLGFDFVESSYFAANYPGAGILKRILGIKYTANLYLAVYQKYDTKPNKSL